MKNKLPEGVERYEERFCKKRKLSDGSSSEYIHLKGTALDKDMRDFIHQEILSAYTAGEQVGYEKGFVDGQKKAFEVDKERVFTAGRNSVIEEVEKMGYEDVEDLDSEAITKHWNDMEQPEEKCECGNRSKFENPHLHNCKYFSLQKPEVEGWERTLTELGEIYGDHDYAVMVKTIKSLLLQAREDGRREEQKRIEQLLLPVASRMPKEILAKIM